MAGDRPPPYESAAGQHGGGQAPALRVGKHGEGQAPALRAGGMAKDRRRRDLPVSMLYLRSGDRKLQRGQQGGGQAPALR